MADHTDIAQGIGIDLGAWAFKGVVAFLAACGLKLRRDVNDLQTVEAKCRAAKEAAKEAGSDMHAERDRQRLAMWEELKALRQEFNESQRESARDRLETRALVAKIAGKLGI